MTTPTDDLVERLTDTNQTGLDATILVPLLKLLALGEPVEITTLAAETNLSVGDVRAHLAAVPDTEFDEAGRIVGHGLTLRPTQHRFTVEGQELYTWCALDTLMFPTLLGRAARVESVSAASGLPIRLTVEPNGVSSVQPSTAVVSVINPDDLTSIRSSFCNQVHFFTSEDDAGTWLAAHPDGEVMPIADAYRLGASLTTALVARN
jgi:alkylmercury lyase